MSSPLSFLSHSVLYNPFLYNPSDIIFQSPSAIPHHPHQLFHLFHTDLLYYLISSILPGSPISSSPLYLIIWGLYIFYVFPTTYPFLGSLSNSSYLPLSLVKMSIALCTNFIESISRQHRDITHISQLSFCSFPIYSPNIMPNSSPSPNSKIIHSDKSPNKLHILLPLLIMSP